VGDKTSIVVVPMVRACGLPVGKMSGRGLGFSGGTLDKLEAIPGLRTDLSKNEFLKQLGSIGVVLSGQSVDLAPADGKLYALRDVTGTVQSTPLIASSIMSKKIAAGADAILLDVKTGNGAFMQTIDEAKQLAKLMVSIGQLSGREVIALLSDMNQPLGIQVGNALEMKEAILALSGEGPEDFVAHCLEVASHMLVLGKKAETNQIAKAMAQEAIVSGRGLEILKKLVGAQGGDVRYIDDPDRFNKAPVEFVVKSSQSGFVKEVHARTVGETAVGLGAGRKTKGDSIDPAVGISVLVKVGDKVDVDQPLFVVYARNETAKREAQTQLEKAIQFSDTKVVALPHFYGLVN